MASVLLAFYRNITVSYTHLDVYKRQDFVVTEYGMAALRGATLKERAKALIGIAHPDFRDELLDEAKCNYLL